MGIAKVELRLSDSEKSSNVAFGTVWFDEGMGVRIKIFNSDKGAWVSWPRYKTNKVDEAGRDKWDDHVIFTKGSKESIDNEILDSFNNLYAASGGKTETKSAEKTESKPASSGASRAWGSAKKK